MLVMVFMPTSAASALFTLVVRVALAAVRLTFWRFCARSSAVGSLLSALSTWFAAFSRFCARSCELGMVVSDFCANAGKARATAATMIATFISRLLGVEQKLVGPQS